VSDTPAVVRENWLNLGYREGDLRLGGEEFMRGLLGGGLLILAFAILLLTGWDIVQSFGPSYVPTTIFSWAGHGPIQIFWGFYAVIATLLIWRGTRLLRRV